MRGLLRWECKFRDKIHGAVGIGAQFVASSHPRRAFMGHTQDDIHAICVIPCVLSLCLACTLS